METVDASKVVEQHDHGDRRQGNSLSKHKGNIFYYDAGMRNTPCQLIFVHAFNCTNWLTVFLFISGELHDKSIPS